MTTLLECHPLTPDGQWRRVQPPNANFAPQALIAAACMELGLAAQMSAAGLHEASACERLAAWLLSGNVPRQPTDQVKP